MFLVRDAAGITALDLFIACLEQHAILQYDPHSMLERIGRPIGIKVSVLVEIISNPITISFLWLLITDDGVIADIHPRCAKLDIFTLNVAAASP